VKLNPISRGRKPNVYCAEPYVTPGNIEGPDSAHFGRGGWTWYSGSAAWLFKVGLEWIIGVRPTVDGLLVDPCIPSKWKGYRVKRTFRGAVYNVEVRNPESVEWGVKEVWVDGKPLGASIRPRQTTLPVYPAGTVHDVVVVLGRTAPSS
jgi:cellobiose phosphorylase